METIQAPISLPFRSYAQALQERYGVKTYKLTLSGGLTCPTRDGTYGPKTGWGGCSFCDIHGSASYHSNLRKELSVKEQMAQTIPSLRERLKAERFIAYFQSYTTTHQEIDEFRARYDDAVSHPDVVALAVGTRPDCMPDEVIALLCSYLDRVDVNIEIGVQSFSDSVLQWFDRGHDVACARDAIARTLALGKKRELEAGRPGSLHVCAHLILGTPGETLADLEAAALELNRLGVHGVKLHNLHLLTKTKLARLYAKEKFPLFGMEEYMERTLHFLRFLDPDIVVHRTHGVASHVEELVAPDWSRLKVRPAQYLRDLMLERGVRQGDLLP